MRHILSSCVIAITAMLVCSSSIYAGGLSTSFVEAKLENLELGKTYSVKEMTKREVVVKNTTTDKTVPVKIEPEAPTEGNLVPGYEPIPDISWVKVTPDYFEAVAPGTSAKADVFITIPQDAKYHGKKYQVYIYSHTAGQAMFRVGLMSRVFLHIK